MSAHIIPTEVLANQPLTRPRSVLLVDDDPAILNVAHAALLQAGYDCIKTRSPLRALDALQTQRFDLLISDATIPGMSGLDLATQALQLIDDLSVIIMSDHHEIEIPVQAIRAGTTDYLIKPFDVEDLRACVSRALTKKESLFERNRHRDQLNQWDAAARAFSLSLNARDKETEGHAERVILYSQRLGIELGLSKEELVSLQLGARLHDIGKIGVPDSVLKKPFPLTDGEKEIMSLHPARGEEMVRMMMLPDAAAQIVGQHHEKWDGGGYPRGLRGEEIHIGARVFAVVDTYDAITSNRVYRAAQPYEAALAEIIKYRGTQFDPAVVDAFVRVDKADWLAIKSRFPCEDILESAVA